MAMSACPKCGKGSFEVGQTDVSGCSWTIPLIQCSSCGTVVGPSDESVVKLVIELKEKIDALSQAVENIR